MGLGQEQAAWCVCVLVRGTFPPSFCFLVAPSEGAFTRPFEGGTRKQNVERWDKTDVTGVLVWGGLAQKERSLFFQKRLLSLGCVAGGLPPAGGLLPCVEPTHPPTHPLDWAVSAPKTGLPHGAFACPELRKSCS